MHVLTRFQAKGAELSCGTYECLSVDAFARPHTISSRSDLQAMMFVSLLADRTPSVVLTFKSLHCPLGEHDGCGFFALPRSSLSGDAYQ